MRFLFALACVVLLGRGAAAQDDLATLVAQLRGKDSTKWTRAYTELQRRKDPKVIPLLLEAAPHLTSTSPQMYTVWIINALPDSKGTRAALWKLAGMEPLYLRARAAQALFNKGEPGIEKVTLDIIAKTKAQPLSASTVLGGLSGVKDAATQKALLAWLDEKPQAAVYAQLIGYFHMLKDRTHVPDVVAPHIADEDTTLRALAATYLFAYGDPAGRAKHAGIAAAAIASGEVAYTAFLKIDSMLTLGPAIPKSLLDALASQVEEQEGYYVVRLLGLLVHGRHAGVTALARKLLDHSDANVSKTAFDILASSPGGFTREALAKHLQSADDAQRLLAAESLLRADDPSGLPIVIDVLKNGSLTHRRSAARAASAFTDNDLVDVLLAAMADSDSSVRSYASVSLLVMWRRMFPYRRLEFGTVGWDANANVDVRTQALKALSTWWTANRTATW